MTRHELRDRTFRLCFRAEFYSGEEMDEQIRLFWEDAENGLGGNAREKDAAFVRSRIEGLLEHLEEIDALLNACTTGWETSRMGKAELAILRLAVYEMNYDTEIEDGIAINEAVELAKKYGPENAGSFVNAVLSNVQRAREKEAGGAQEEEAKAEAAENGDAPGKAAKSGGAKDALLQEADALRGGDNA